MQGGRLEDKRRVWVSESSKERHLGCFCLLRNKVCCVLLPWLLQQHRGEAEQSIQADDGTRQERGCWDFLWVLDPTDKLWLTRAQESIAGIAELKEEQWESNLTGLLITRLIFQTLCILPGWRGVKAGWVRSFSRNRSPCCLGLFAHCCKMWEGFKLQKRYSAKCSNFARDRCKLIFIS